MAFGFHQFDDFRFQIKIVGTFFLKSERKVSGKPIQRMLS
jgi:hypothetical protein